MDILEDNFWFSVLENWLDIILPNPFSTLLPLLPTLCVLFLLQTSGQVLWMRAWRMRRV